MRFVERADRMPQHCAVLPTLGAGHRKGYFDTGNIIPGWDPHVYVSIEAVEQLALKLGWSSPETVAEAANRLEQAERRIRLLEEQLAEADEELGAIHVLKGRGYTTARKPGRPAKAA